MRAELGRVGYYYCDFSVSASWCVFKLFLIEISGEEFQKYFEQRTNHITFQGGYLEVRYSF